MNCLDQCRQFASWERVIGDERGHQFGGHFEAARVHRADDERAHRNFRLRHLSVLGGLAPRLSSAAVICNKSVSYKIGLTQDAPPQVIVWTKCDE